MTYSDLLRKLYSITYPRGMKFGLENSHRLNQLLDFPTKKFQSIHVAGTNGKGSVCTKIAKALQLEGYKVGLYTSPHIACFRERIRINDCMISKEDVAAQLEHLFNVCQKHIIPATFFELTTLMAFCHFAEHKVDIAVLETGLGGALDSTNIVTPKLSIITSLSLDHTAILGETLEAIAKEKAGIIKRGVPVVLGPHVPRDLIAPYAHARNASCYQVEGCFYDFRMENNAIASKALELLKVASSHIALGIQALPPCRLELLPKPQFKEGPWPKAVILDVAHNPNGLANLFSSLKRQYPDQNFRVLCGFSKDKDLAGCFSFLSEHASAIHLLEAPHERAASTEQLALMLSKLGFPKHLVYMHASFEETMWQAIQAASEEGEVLVVCGTFFIMAKVRKALGVIEPCDPMDFN